MLFQRWVNWNDVNAGFKRGRVIKKYLVRVVSGLDRMKFVLQDEPPIFSKRREYFSF